jgi:hypothetical protein
LFASALALLVGCSPAKAPKHAVPPPQLALSDADINVVIRDVSVARGLAPKRPVRVMRLDQKRFLEHLLDHERPPSKEDELAEAGFLLGFDFVPPPSQRAGTASLEDVQKEEVVGYYHRRDDVVYLPDKRFATQKEVDDQRAIVAHEVQHALAAQVFAPLPTPQTDDQSIAELSLIEGDATVAMGAMLGFEAGAPMRRTMRRLADLARDMPLSKLADGRKRSIDRAPIRTRTRLEFPYLEGMRFVADLYRAGGFGLVNAAYTTPPESTEHILHPNKYLAGELARVIGDPAPGDGEKRISVDTLGELDVRILLERCLDKIAASKAAEGWAGDRYAVFSRADGHVSVAWISAWDSEEDADQIATALSRSQACWHDNASAELRVGSDIDVERRGKVVAFLRGVPVSERAKARDRLFPIVGPERQNKPISELRVPPSLPLPEPRRGVLQGDLYRNDWLGLIGRVPSGMRVDVGREGLELAISRSDVVVKGGLALSTRETTPAQNERTFREVETAFARAIASIDGGQALSLELSGNGPFQTSLGLGVARTWRVSRTMIELELVIVPICEGSGSVVFVRLFGDPFAKSVLDGWLSTFRWTYQGAPLACSYLNPQ